MKNDGTQKQRFIETARALGADEDEDAFKAKLGQIALQKPKDGPVAGVNEKALERFERNLPRNYRDKD